MMERLSTPLATSTTTAAAVMDKKDTSDDVTESCRSVKIVQTIQSPPNVVKEKKKHLIHLHPSSSGKPQLTTIGNNLASLQYIIQQKEAEINNLKQIVMAHMKLIDSLRKSEQERTKEINHKSHTIDVLLSKIDEITKQKQCECKSVDNKLKVVAKPIRENLTTAHANLKKQENSHLGALNSMTGPHSNKRSLEGTSTLATNEECSKKVKKSQPKEIDFKKATVNDVLSSVKVRPKTANKKARPSLQEKTVTKKSSTNLTEADYYSMQNPKIKRTENLDLNDQQEDCENEELCFFTTQDDYEIFSVMNTYDIDGPSNTILSIDTIRAESPGSIDRIEVPSWRINHLNPSTDIELLENLDDETYNRRHMKHEIEERRRKRWDLQRLREQNLKMKHGNTQLYQYQKRSKDCAEFEDESIFKSFFPSVSDMRFIEINNEVPVVAFGRPVPKISKKWFSFPESDARPLKIQ